MQIIYLKTSMMKKYLHRKTYPTNATRKAKAVFEKINTEAIQYNTT